MKRPTDSKPYDNGFTPEAKALIYLYRIEIYAMPKSGQWKEFQLNFEPNKTIVPEKLNFNENQIVNQVEQVTLKTEEG